MPTSWTKVSAGRSCDEDVMSHRELITVAAQLGLIAGPLLAFQATNEGRRISLNTCASHSLHRHFFPFLQSRTAEPSCSWHIWATDCSRADMTLSCTRTATRVSAATSGG